MVCSSDSFLAFMGVEVFYAVLCAERPLNMLHWRLAPAQWEPPRQRGDNEATRGLPMDGLLSSEAPAFEPVGVEGADAYRFEPAELGRLLGQVSLRRLSGPLLAPPTQPVRTAAGGREPH